MTTKSKKSGVAWVRAAAKSPRTWVWLTAALAACGLKLNLNGQTHVIGGGDAAQTASATTPTASGGTASRAHGQAATTADDEPHAPVNYKAATLTVKGALTSTPDLAVIEGVALDSRFRKTIGTDSPDCGQTVSSHPIATIDVQTADAGMQILVAGGHGDGFVVKHGDQVWAACNSSSSGIPMMSAPKTGWQTGRYDVYPVSRFTPNLKDGFRFEVAVSNPAHLAPWSGDVRAIKVEGKLAAPLFVDVPLHANRRVLSGAFAGSSCDKVALAFEPDVSLHVMRPIAGLVVRPLPSRSPVTVRVEQRTDDKRTSYFCTRMDRGGNPAKGPSWQPPSEVHLDKEEGVWGLSFGTAPDAKDDKITLMIYDAETAFQPLAVRPLPGDGALDLEHRAVAWHFPQLDVSELDMRTREHAELAAKVFATAPAGVFVYPDLDLDKDVAQVEGNVAGDGFPKKNEPLLVLDVERGDRARVLAQDGFEYDVKATHLALAPDGAAALLTAPRPLRANLDIYAYEAFNSDTKAIAELDAWEKHYSTCVDNVAAPYERQIPRVVSSDGSSIELEDGRTRSLRDAEDTAIIHACGSRDAHDKGRDKFRAKFAAAADKTRAALLATAKPKL